MLKSNTEFFLKRTIKNLSYSKETQIADRELNIIKYIN